MIVIFDECKQPKTFADNVGLCLIELESGDDVDSIIKEYTKERPWYERAYSEPRKLSEYKYSKYDFKQQKNVYETITGNLVLFNTFQWFLD